jgi:dephospho-CoA kinase
LPSKPKSKYDAEEFAMLRVGLTGGIACGKSTVSRMFRDLDIPILDADPLAHELLEPGQPVYDQVHAEFGDTVLAADKSIDRAKLGPIVFGDPEKMRRLNQIIHPRIVEIVDQWFATLDQPGGASIAIVEAALLIEAGYRPKLNCLIVVRCTPGQQLARLRERGLNEIQAQQRIASQIPIEDKVKVADEIIDGGVSFEETSRQVRDLTTRLKLQAAKS